MNHVRALCSLHTDDFPYSLKNKINMFKSILSKILIPIILMTIILVAATMAISVYTFSKYARESFDVAIRTVAHDMEKDIKTMQSSALDQANGFASNFDMVAAIKDMDAAIAAGKKGNTSTKEEIIAAIDANKPLHEEIGKIIDRFKSNRRCDFFTMVDPDGNVIYRSDKTEQYGDSQRSLKCVTEVITKGNPCVYFESTPNIRLSIRAAAPILDENGKMIGIACGGFRVDRDRWVDYIKEQYNVECTVFSGDERIATTVLNDEGKRAVGTKLNNAKIYDKVFRDREPVFSEAAVIGKPMTVFYHPIANGDEDVMGMYFAGIPMERQKQMVWQNTFSNLTVTVIGLFVFVIVVYGIINTIVTPIRKMAAAAEDLADGNLNVIITVNTKDETATLATAFQHLANSLKAKTGVALAIAQGDLTVWVPLRSQYDELGLSLIRMRYSLFDSIKDLKDLAQTVNNEAVSLTGVNQALVNNTTHSAEQLKEIAESIRSFHTKTVQNAEEARSAESLTKSAQDGSNDGKEKMGRMVQAMNAISKSSDEIKKIIRVIDDIAFQTNLLALNAAVEAARAGQHGKGFAVVAEEVRNLASRSAKAARETAGLIEESIQHVGLGSHVAQETSESLNVITEQVERINKIVSIMSEGSDRQAKHLGEMTNTVNQVSSTADANMQSVQEVTGVISSISNTAKGLDAIITHFKSNPGGKVMVEGTQPEGYIPPHGTRFGFYKKNTEKQ